MLNSISDMEKWHSHLLRERVDQTSLLIQGNRACALGALDAGVTFFAGYPITPSSEIMEAMAEELPRSGGVFVQMEDEIASICACVGASLTGKLAMTATSGPGFSLMQEGIGYGIMVEAPLLVVNVMRVGPSTGRPTAPSQGDVMQARWGTHGDHPAIVLAASNVADMYRLTMAAVRFAQRFRTPVTLLADQMVGQMRESFSPELVGRYMLTSGDFDFTPGYIHPDVAPEVRNQVVLGSGEPAHATGLFHDETGFPTDNPEKSADLLARPIQQGGTPSQRTLSLRRQERGQGQGVHSRLRFVCTNGPGCLEAGGTRGSAGRSAPPLHAVPTACRDHPEGRAAGRVHAHSGAQSGSVRSRSAQDGRAVDHGHRNEQDRRHAVHAARGARPRG